MKYDEVRESVHEELSRLISRLARYELDKQHIYASQENGASYIYGIQALKPEHPVLAMRNDYHRNAFLTLTLPYSDAQRLYHEEIRADQYIETAYFNYGYSWGGNGMTQGSYWQPLESGPGIHDSKRISRYLNLLRCRTLQACENWKNTESYCLHYCGLDPASCPLSPQSQNADWRREEPEPDRRLDLFQAIGQMTEYELGFRLSGNMAHSGDRNELRLVPSRLPDTVDAYVSRELLNDLLYYPGQTHDWGKMVQNLTTYLVKPLDPSVKIIVPSDSCNKRELCREFWCVEEAEWKRFKEQVFARSIDGKIRDPKDIPPTINTQTGHFSQFGHWLQSFHRRIFS